MNAMNPEEIRESLKEFTYDFSYWSVDRTNGKYASQEQVTKDTIESDICIV